MSNFDMNTTGSDINYAEIIIKDMYNILTTKKNPWPEEYSRRDKIIFLDKMLGYFTEREMFERCVGINRVKQEIVDEGSD